MYILSKSKIYLNTNWRMSTDLGHLGLLGRSVARFHRYSFVLISFDYPSWLAVIRPIWYDVFASKLSQMILKYKYKTWNLFIIIKNVNQWCICYENISSHQLTQIDYFTRHCNRFSDFDPICGSPTAKSRAKSCNIDSMDLLKVFRGQVRRRTRYSRLSEICIVSSIARYL